VSLLSGLEWVKSAARGGDYLMVETPPEKAADVNDFLVGNGVRVSEMRPYESSLEEFFLDTVEAGTETAEVQNAQAD
jgi:ABC-2 type transport system ATP-binding protein